LRTFCFRTGEFLVAPSSTNGFLIPLLVLAAAAAAVAVVIAAGIIVVIVADLVALFIVLGAVALLSACSILYPVLSACISTIPPLNFCNQLFETNNGSRK
jgi:hypothetical protein